MKLSNVNIGETFKVAGIEFVKFSNDGEKVFAVTKDSLFYSVFGDNGNFAESKVKNRLEEELLPKLETEIGAENIFEFETDLTALDGTRPYENVTSKVGLVTLDFYRKHRNTFEKYKPDKWWWLATPDSEKYSNIILSVAPAGNGSNYFNIYGGVRPILLFSSSISVSCN